MELNNIKSIFNLHLSLFLYLYRKKRKLSPFSPLKCTFVLFLSYRTMPSIKVNEWIIYVLKTTSSGINKQLWRGEKSI